VEQQAVDGVRDLILRYADALNLYDLDAFADAFAEDGVWDVSPYFKGVGRHNVREVFAVQRNAFDWVFQVVHGTRVLSMEADRAKARSYIAEYGNRSGQGYFMLGVYHDQCVRQGVVWRFANRKFNPLYMGPPDLSVPPKHYPAPNHF
jgi:hypothetical protein